MANSSYYYKQYKTYKDQASKYDKNIKTLTKIKDSLTNNFYDEQNNVNRELNDLKEDLNKAVRHDSKFLTIASECEFYKEKSITADNDLNNVIIALENEIAALDGKKITSEQNRDAQYQNYSTKKNEERQEWLNSIHF